MPLLDPAGGATVSTPVTAVVPPTTSSYWPFYEAVAEAQLQAWLPGTRLRVLDLSGDGPRRARLLRDAGHEVLRVGDGPVTGVTTLMADTRSLPWLQDEAVDAVVAESRALSACLAAEETARDLVRVLRPGGRLLLVVDSLVTGLAHLADQGRWAELADVPSADVVLVPGPDGTITRCFWPEELQSLLEDSGFDVEWVRPRTVLTPATVERAVAAGGDEALRALVRTELALSAEREGETGLHLVASARRRCAESSEASGLVGLVLLLADEAARRLRTELQPRLGDLLAAVHAHAVRSGVQAGERGLRLRAAHLGGLDEGLLAVGLDLLGREVLLVLDDLALLLLLELEGGDDGVGLAHDLLEVGTGSVEVHGCS